jgi:hypothetical protein
VEGAEHRVAILIQSLRACYAKSERACLFGQFLGMRPPTLPEPALQVYLAIARALRSGEAVREGGSVDWRRQMLPLSLGNVCLPLKVCPECYLRHFQFQLVILNAIMLAPMGTTHAVVAWLVPSHWGAGPTCLPLYASMPHRASFRAASHCGGGCGGVGLGAPGALAGPAAGAPGVSLGWGHDQEHHQEGGCGHGWGVVDMHFIGRVCCEGRLRQAVS